MPLAKLLAGLPPLGQIHDRRQGGIDEALVLLAEKLKIQKDLRQKRPVERLSHDRSAEASGVRGAGPRPSALVGPIDNPMGLGWRAGLGTRTRAFWNAGFPGPDIRITIY